MMGGQGVEITSIVKLLLGQIVNVLDIEDISSLLQLLNSAIVSKSSHREYINE